MFVGILSAFGNISKKKNENKGKKGDRRNIITTPEYLPKENSAQ